MSKVKTIVPALGILLLGSFVFWRLGSHSQNYKILSPDPDIKGEKVEEEANYSRELEPPFRERGVSGTENLPEISALGAIAIDLSDNTIIFKKDPHRRLPIASTVKILTAAVALEHKEPNDIITVSFQAERVGESSMGLSVGEKLKLEDLLYGLLLPSGNDAAEAIAEGVGERREIFVAWMNDKVKSIGLKNSHFTNPSGLDDTKNDQYSSAYDLAIIANEALGKFPSLRKIVATKEKVIKATSEHKAYSLKNRLSFDQTYPGIIGVKPGFTDEAGLCLISLAKNRDREILAVFLNSQSPPEDAKRIFSFGFSQK